MLTPEEQAEHAALCVLESGIESLEAFINRSDARYPSPAHTAAIREPFERARHGPTRTLLSAPPRHAKTYTIKHGLARMAVYDPALENAYVSATATLATDKSEEIRQIAKRGGGATIGRRNNWRTPQGGRLIALGIDGQYTGTGTTGMQVFDDPYPTASHALSANYRKKVETYREGTAENRCEGNASRLILHTRFHIHDLIGTLLKSEGHRWNHVRLQAVQDFDEGAADYELDKERRRQALKAEYRSKLLERGVPIPEQLQPDYPSWQGLQALHIPVSDELAPEYSAIGRPLWPEYWPLERLLPFMRHKRWWYAVFQQDPRPDGSQVFDREPSRFLLKDWRLPDGTFRLHKMRVGIGGDPAATEKQTADYSVGVLMAVRGFGNATEAWVLDVQRHQESTTAFAQRLVRWQRKYQCPVYVEAVGGFKSVPQIMDLVGQLGPQQYRCAAHGVVVLSPQGTCGTCFGPVEFDSGRMRIHEAPALGSKLLRAQPWSAIWNDGRAYVPQDAPWADEFIAEHQEFTGLDGETDDQVDAASHVFNALYSHAPGLARGAHEALSFPFG